MASILRQLGQWVAAFELPLVLVLLPTLILIDKLLWLGVAVWLVLMVLRWYATSKALRMTPVTLILAVFVLLIPITLWITPLPIVTRGALGYLIAGLVVFQSIVNWVDSRSRLWWLLAGVMMILIVMAAVTPLLEPVLARQLPDRLRRLALAIPEQVNPNVISGAIALWLPVAAVLVWRPLAEGRNRQRMLRILALVAVTLGGLALLALSSRGAWLAVALGAALAATIRWTRLWRLTPLVVAALWLALTQGSLQQLAGLLFPSDSLAGFEARQEIWNHALDAIQDFAVTGMGMGTWPRLGPLLYPYTSIGPDQVIPHAHNLFLQVGIDLGAIGLVAFVALFGLSLTQVVKAYRRLDAGGQNELALLALAVTAGLFTMLVHGLIDAVSWGTKPAVLSWTLMALTSVLFLFASTGPQQGGGPAVREREHGSN